jgi:hypothetical protein
LAGEGSDSKEDALVALAELNYEIKLLIGFMKSHRKIGHFSEMPVTGKPESPRVTFFRKMYELYVDLKKESNPESNAGLSNEGRGPGMRFITECGVLVGIGRAPPRQTILSSLSRARRAKIGTR